MSVITDRRELPQQEKKRKKARKKGHRAYLQYLIIDKENHGGGKILLAGVAGYHKQGATRLLERPSKRCVTRTTIIILEATGLRSIRRR
ncbi:hypothetical protein FQA39_LY08798 [Lamprigera yunnana]|nr:hypothetical protein FQA39_LY08798 [Lamprigera yunnana]